MHKKYNIGIVGKGFVGSAVAYGFSPQCGYDANIRIYDKDPSKSNSSLKETVNESDFVFLSEVGKEVFTSQSSFQSRISHRKIGKV